MLRIPRNNKWKNLHGNNRLKQIQPNKTKHLPSPNIIIRYRNKNNTKNTRKTIPRTTNQKLEQQNKRINKNRNKISTSKKPRTRNPGNILQKMKKLNKKADLMSYGSIIVAVLIIAVVFALLFIISKIIFDETEDKFEKDISIKDGSYTTRLLLDTEIQPGYKLYEYIIEATNKQELTQLRQIIQTTLEKYYGGPLTEPWIAKVGDQQTYIGPNTKYISLQDVPTTTIPNPYGQNIEVIIKPITKIDTKNIPRLSDEIKTPETIETDGTTSLTGTELAQIKNIPNIICEEADTNYGKICKANKELVQKLQEMSKELQETKRKLRINQAYRTWEIQNKFWIDSDYNKSQACNPGAKQNPNLECTHMTGGAIDVTLTDEKGNAVSDSEREALMCKYGFVRYIKERWHYEYDTSRTKRAQDLSEKQGGQVCAIL